MPDVSCFVRSATKPEMTAPVLVQRRGDRYTYITLYVPWIPCMPNHASKLFTSSPNYGHGLATKHLMKQEASIFFSGVSIFYDPDPIRTIRLDSCRISYQI